MPKIDLHENCYNYSELSLKELFQWIIPFSDISLNTIEKILFRVQHNHPCNFDYLVHTLNISKKHSYVILTAIELLRRNICAKANKIEIKSPQDIINFIQKQNHLIAYEMFYVVLMNHKNHIIELKEMSVGSVGEVNVNINHVLKHILCSQSSRVIFYHTHPLGDPLPSKHDVLFTKKVKKFFLHLDIELLDHIIVAKGSYYSFKNNCLRSLNINS